MNYLKNMLFSASATEKKIYNKFPSIVHTPLDNLFRDNRYIWEKLRNFRLNESETAANKSHLTSYPYQLLFDPTNICNLKCPLCPTWQDLKARPKGKMSLAMFKKILDETGPYLFAVNLCNWGEPLLNPDLPGMVRYAKKYNTVVGLSTNLNYLPDELAPGIAESGIDIMIISIDGASPESYSRYRRGGDLKQVLENIRKLNSCRNTGEKFPILVWQFLVNRYNEHEIDEAENMALKMGLHFIASPIRTSMGKELLMPLYQRVNETREWLPENPAFSKYSYEIGPETRTAQKTCRWLWNSAVVNWDGSLSPCCGVFEKKWDFQTCYAEGNNKMLTFHQVWNSPRYILARQLVAAYMKKSRGIDALIRKAEEQGVICSKCIRYGFLED
jgi:MoaA/NifB/PqqE/SkfB family radical SAM enzyme